MASSSRRLWIWGVDPRPVELLGRRPRRGAAAFELLIQLSEPVLMRPNLVTQPRRRRVPRCYELDEIRQLALDLPPFLSQGVDLLRRRAVELPQHQISHPLAVGEAHLGLAVHAYFTGRWDEALSHFERSATTYRDAGALHEAETAMALPFHIYVHGGRFDAALAAAERTTRVGRETGDAQVTAWGLQELGDVLQITGPLEQAIAYLREAATLFRAVPDYGGWAETLSDLAHAYLRQGDMAPAFRVLEESHRVLIERRVKSHQAVQPFVVLADAWLMQAESVAKRQSALSEAWPAPPRS